MRYAFVCALVASCNNSFVLDADRYDQSCDVADDCIVVVDGDQCECGDHCGAINVAERERRSADVNDLPGCGFSVAPACPDGDQPGLICQEKTASCVEGECVVD